MATILSTISNEALDELRTLVRGSVQTPEDAGYDGVQAPYNAMHIERPASSRSSSSAMAAAAIAWNASLDLFSAGIGCQVYQPFYGMDLATLCLRGRRGPRSTDRCFTQARRSWAR